MLLLGKADEKNKLGQTQRKWLCTEMATTLPGFCLGDAKHPCVTVHTHHQKRVHAVAFFNKRTKHRGTGRNANEWASPSWLLSLQGYRTPNSQMQGWEEVQVWNHQDSPPGTPLCHWRMVSEGQLSAWEGRASSSTCKQWQPQATSLQSRAMERNMLEL